jgi:FkbM family methyltransferase
LDCGANVGVFTKTALAKGARTVVAIEPNPEAIECLRRTFAAEIAAKRVIAYPKGVWDRDDVLELMLSPADPAMDGFVIRYGNLKSSVKVPLTTIDELAAELQLRRVDFIKMDIEGSEQRALSGARGVLRANHPRLAISAYHLADDPKRIPEIVKSAWSGYRQECGFCEDKYWDIRPNVYYFR